MGRGLIIMPYPDECPDCKKDLIYTAPDGKIGYHVIGLYDRDRDMTTRWKCPFCDYVWRRKGF